MVGLVVVLDLFEAYLALFVIEHKHLIRETVLAI
jgi:hypothetical protein